jgi:hypothetical protein
MRGHVFVPVLLLWTAVPALGAPSIVAEVASGIGISTAPVTFPINFGTRDLGDIADADLTLCFRQDTSPPGACDAGGTVALQEMLSPPFYLAGQFREIVATGVKTPVNFPVTLQAGQRLEFVTQWVANQLDGVDDDLVLRLTQPGSAAEEVTLSHSGTGQIPGPCIQIFNSLCLNNNRFKVQGHYLTLAADSGPASMVRLTGDTGYLFFFSPSNVEAVVKVLNACSFNNRYWVFAGGLTDVRTVITVTDTQRNTVRTYVNPQGKAFQPIQDTSAFATCP